MSYTTYSRKILDQVYTSLGESQREVLDHYVMRGLKTKWLNIWTKQLGREMTTSDLEDLDTTMAALLEWVLVDFKDYGSVQKDVTCECGRKLRYCYTIKNMKTGKVYHLGATHFQEHTGIDSEMANLVLKELKKIDLEKDEILTKMKEEWQLPFKVPELMEIPDDMQAQFKVGLPLLERQEKRLSECVKAYQKQKQQEELKQWIHRIEPEVVLQKLEQEAYKVSIEELMGLYAYLKKQPDFFKTSAYDFNQFKKIIQKAEGQVLDRSKRKWLVELEYL